MCREDEIAKRLEAATIPKRKSAKDRTGERVGVDGCLTAVRRSTRRNSRGFLWEYECSHCGETTEMRPGAAFKAKSCGCMKTAPESLPKERAGEITGVGGCLTAIEPARCPESGRILWRYACACCGGTKAMTPGYANRAKHCGCLRDWHGHNMVNSPTYRCWRSMRQRCLDKNHKGYQRYGAVGITICPEWGTFTVFLEQMGERPSLRHSIDRLNGAKVYSKATCRWATPIEQNNNTSRNVRFMLGSDRPKTISEICRERGLNVQRVRTRVRGLGWSIEDAIAIPRLSPSQSWAHRKGKATAALIEGVSPE